MPKPTKVTNSTRARGSIDDLTQGQLADEVSRTVVGRMPATGLLTTVVPI